MIKLFKIFLMAVILLSSSVFAQENQTKEEDFWGNRGYIYYNPEISEKPAKVKPQKIIPPKEKVSVPLKPTPQIPTKIPQIPIEKPTYLKKEEPKEMPREEKVMTAEEEVIYLREKLKKTLRQLALANQKIKELKEKKPSPKTTQTYLVKKGDCLWKIAGKKEVYGNSYKWLLLYHANRDQIYDPNLIFPDMVLIVPRLEEYERNKE